MKKIYYLFASILLIVCGMTTVRPQNETEKFPYTAHCAGDNVNVRVFDESFTDWEIPIDKTQSYLRYPVVCCVMKGYLIRVHGEKGGWCNI
jgi:hypothetical protein